MKGQKDECLKSPAFACWDWLRIWDRLDLELKPPADPPARSSETSRGSGSEIRWWAEILRCPLLPYLRRISLIQYFKSSTCDSVLPSWHHPYSSITTVLPRENSAPIRDPKIPSVPFEPHCCPCEHFWIVKQLSGSLLLFKYFPSEFLRPSAPVTIKPCPIWATQEIYSLLFAVTQASLFKIINSSLRMLTFAKYCMLIWA